MQVPNTFNIFDLFVKFFPGSVLIICLYELSYICVKPISDAVLLCFYISMSYVLGSLLYGASKVSITPLINKIIFGDRNLRKVYAKKASKRRLPVIANDATREKISKMTEKEPDAEFLFEKMINTLEIKGYNEKEDRMEGSAAMCSSMCLVCIVLLIACILTKACAWLWLFSIAGIVLFALTYVVYTIYQIQI